METCHVYAYPLACASDVCGDVTATYTTNQNGTGIPLTQLLVCMLKASDTTPININFTLPVGSVTLFDSMATCPSNWQPVSFSNRTILPNVGATSNYGVPSLGSGMQVGGPLAQHSHLAEGIIYPVTAYAFAASACCNGSPTSVGRQWGQGPTAMEDANLPYTSLLACEALAGAHNVTAAVPPNMLIFSSPSQGSVCPPGWQPVNAVEVPLGRFVVGMPDGGSPALTYGSNFSVPLGALQYNNTHNHTVNDGTAPPNVVHIAVSGADSGNTWAAGNVPYPFTIFSMGAASSSPSGETLGQEGVNGGVPPYVQLMLCEQIPA